MYQLLASDSSGGSMPGYVIGIVLVVLAIAGMWKTFTKANRSGWMSIIPILSTYVVIRMAKRPGWWIVLYLIPIVNIVIHLMVSIDLAKRFGKDGVFGFFGLFLFPYIGYLILGFGDAKYKN